MSRTVISREGDTLSSIAHAHYGSAVGRVEQILKANPRLCRAPAVLPAGLAVTLPDHEAAAPVLPTVNLWD